MNNNRKLKVLTILVSAAISNLSGISVVSASVVNNLLPYQIYRDFAENKGDFIPGTESLELYNNSGLLVTTLNKAPMPFHLWIGYWALPHLLTHNMSSVLSIMVAIVEYGLVRVIIL